jgi:hypothetical protein
MESFKLRSVHRERPVPAAACRERKHPLQPVVESEMRLRYVLPELIVAKL